MKLKVSNLKFFLLLFPFIEPLLFKESGYEKIDTIYSILKIIALMVIALNYILDRKKEQNKISVFTVAVISLELIIFFSTLLNSGDIIRFFGPAVTIVALVLLTQIYLPKLKGDFFKVLYFYLFFLMIVNTIFLILFPEGLYINRGGSSMYFLGIDNRFIFFYLPLIYSSIVYSIITNNKLNIWTYITVCICLYSVIACWSVGALLGLLLIVLAVLLQDRIKIITKIKMKYFIIAIIIINLLIVFFQIQNHFGNFIVNVLKKDITFSGRTYVWENALQIFKLSPIIGVGMQPAEYFQNYYFGVAHAHNIFLNYMTICGISGLIVYVFLLFLVAKKSLLIKDGKIRCLSNFVVFTILFLSIADTLDAGLFFLVYACIYYYSEVFEE